jgi:hypothetical protein
MNKQTKISLIVIFGLIAIGLVIVGFYFLIKKAPKTEIITPTDDDDDDDDDDDI